MRCTQHFKLQMFGFSINERPIYSNINVASLYFLFCFNIIQKPEFRKILCSIRCLRQETGRLATNDHSQGLKMYVCHP